MQPRRPSLDEICEDFTPATSVFSRRFVPPRATGMRRYYYGRHGIPQTWPKPFVSKDRKENHAGWLEYLDVLFESFVGILYILACDIPLEGIAPWRRSEKEIIERDMIADFFELREMWPIIVDYLKGFPPNRFAFILEALLTRLFQKLFGVKVLFFLV